MNKDKTLTTKWQDETALYRFQLIAPLQDEALDSDARIALRRRIAEDNGLSDKTIKRYYDAFLQEGFEGLKPQSRRPHNLANLPDNYAELLLDAIQLRREVPQRSVDKIITILELEGKVAPGVLKRSTMQRHLYKAGFGRTHLDVHAKARESSSKRFCKPHRMMLLQGDIKYGIKLPIGKNGAKVQTYLSSAIDDHSRMVLASEFYDNQEQSIVEDTFHKVILKYGTFDSCYFDNGSQYVAKQLKLSLAKLSISAKYAPVRSGKSKGKIEKLVKKGKGSFIQRSKEFFAQLTGRSHSDMKAQVDYMRTVGSVVHQSPVDNEEGVIIHKPEPKILIDNDLMDAFVDVEIIINELEKE